MKYILKILIVVMFILKLNESEAAISPILRCISVNPNGSITLNWSFSTDTSLFRAYYIYRTTTFPTGYTLIDSVLNANTLTYTDDNTNGNSQSFAYYIRIKQRNGLESQSSDSLQSIFLTVANPLNNTAILNWNSVRNPLLTTSSHYYEIFRSKGNNSLVIIDSTQTLSYIDSIRVCNDSVFYQIRIHDNSGCSSNSNIKGDLFQDLIFPYLPEFDSVSISRSTDKVILGWQPNPAPDTKGYIICRGNPCITIDTVWGRFNTFYTDLAVNADNASYTYRIAAFDSCNNTSLFTQNQQSLFLKSVLDLCGNKIELTWNDYINMKQNLESYKILVSVNGGSFNSIASLPINQHSYIFTPLQDNTSYCFIIQAINTTHAITSGSNKNCYSIKKPGHPQWFYLRNVSILNSGKVEIKLYTDPTEVAQFYKIYNSTSPAGPWILVTSLSYAAVSDYTTIHINSNTNLAPAYYMAVISDSCGNTGDSTQISKSIYLQAGIVDNFTNTIQWDFYSLWAGSVSEYRLYRLIDNDPIPMLVTTKAGGMTSYNATDDISNFSSSGGMFTYYVEAIEDNTSPYPFTEISRSNQSFVNQQSDIFIPNAFMPDGVNKIFKPVTVFIPNNGYTFQIYTRWGEMIFQTNDPNAGWDGTLHEEKAQPGMYVYYVHFTRPNGAMFQRTGHVSLIR
jgi:gliding motility-associated-like protein